MPNRLSVHLHVRTVAAATALVVLVAGTARAQGRDTTRAGGATVSPAGKPVATAAVSDSARRQAAQDAYERARALVVNGQAAEGRRVVDSLLAAAPAGSATYADALYWRATLAATAADAERDYRRIIVEFPLSVRTADALLALAQLEMTRNDRDAAINHLQRFLLEYPERPERARAGIWLGRLQIETGDVVRGCRQLGRVRASIASGDVELLNQVDYQMARCSGVDTTATAGAPGVPASAIPAAAAPTPAATKPVPAKTATPAAAPAAAQPSRTAARPAGVRYSVQVAAFEEQKDADALVRRLTSRGYEARATQSGRYFRVRVGRYASRAEAVKVRDELKAHGTVGFVTEAEPESN